MKDAGIVSRRDFLRRFPKYLMGGVQKLTGATLKLTEYDSDSERDTPEEKGTKIVKLNIGQCLAWEGIACQYCYLACPLREDAIRMVDQKPVITASACNGCGECVVACQTVNDPPALEMTRITRNHI